MQGENPLTESLVPAKNSKVKARSWLGLGMLWERPKNKESIIDVYNKQRSRDIQLTFGTPYPYKKRKER